jgi:hypothetical protein
MRFAGRTLLLLAVFFVAFYVGTAIFSILDFPRADMSWTECNQAEDCE